MLLIYSRIPSKILVLYFTLLLLTNKKLSSFFLMCFLLMHEQYSSENVSNPYIFPSISIYMYICTAGKFMYVTFFKFKKLKALPTMFCISYHLYLYVSQFSVLQDEF